MIGCGRATTSWPSTAIAEDVYLLATDTAVVVPVGKTIVVQVTGGRRDPFLDRARLRREAGRGARPPGRAVVPCRASEGIYFGQCSELCGNDHAYMPITVKVVSQEAYDAWLDRRDRANTPASRAPSTSPRPSDRRPSRRRAHDDVSDMTTITRPRRRGRVRRLRRAAEAAGDVAGGVHRAGRACWSRRCRCIRWWPSPRSCSSRWAAAPRAR